MEKGALSKGFNFSSILVWAAGAVLTAYLGYFLTLPLETYVDAGRQMVTHNVFAEDFVSDAYDNVGGLTKGIMGFFGYEYGSPTDVANAIGSSNFTADDIFSLD